MSDEDTRWRSIASSIFVDEILLKYNGEAGTDNFFSKMSSQTLAERITALKEHVFSNPNSQSGNSDQTNCGGESKIDLSNNTDPPLRQCVLTNADSEHNQSGLIVDLGKFAQTRDNSEYAEPDNRVANTNNNGETHEPTREDTFCSSSNLALDGTSRPREGIYYNDGRAIDQQALNCGDKLDNIEDGHCCGVPEQINCFPVVVITPAMTEETLDECLDTTSNCKNGALSAAMFSLKDATETCSLSSAGSCSESEILTDEEASDDEIKQPLEDRSEKVDSRWKKIRSMIHWSPFVQNFKKKYPWVQLAGHQGSFKPGENGMILKKATDKERESLRNLMKDILRPYIPEYKGEVHKGNECYLEMQDLLQDFDSPSVMDCKMGTRTYLEDELAKAKSKPRKDLFQKMVEVDPNEPTEDERREGGITKPRYMRWREQLSSSASLGFRIEGIKQGDQKPNKDFKKTKTKEDVNKVFTEFIGSDDKIRRKYLRRLKAIRATLESSPFFRSHEVVGSSLLFVHDAFGKASIWMIDFGKTVPLPDGMWLDHRKPWQEGNHEDGYLWGLDNMVEIWAQS